MSAKTRPEHDMTYRHLVLDLDRSRHIATVTLNKPERLNAIDQNDKVDLLDAIARMGFHERARFHRDDSKEVILYLRERRFAR